MIVRQSTIKQFMECSLRFKFASEGAPRTQSSAMSFGTVIHECVEYMERLIAAGIQDVLAKSQTKFDVMWTNLGNYDLAYDYMLPRNTHQGYSDLGHKILRDWFQLTQWESDIVLAHEYLFTVPMGDHVLSGTADKVVLREIAPGIWAVVIIDFKTGAKQPTRDYLRHDLQFTLYCYASTQPEFWVNIPDGERLFEELKDAPRMGEWVHLRNTRRIPAGERNEIDYNRLRYAIDQIEAAIATGIFVPDISGATCEYCEFRQRCGLPSREQEGLAA